MKILAGFILLLGVTQAQARNFCAEAFWQYLPFSEGRSWDTWVGIDAKTLIAHSYSQWIPHGQITPGSFQFHNRARIYHREYISDGEWKDHGLIDIAGLPKSLRKLGFWSGNTVFHDGKAYLFFTLANRNGKAPQSIHLATSIDGHNFNYQKTIFRWQTIQKQHPDYVFSNRGQIIGALRDPYIYPSHNGLGWTMMFAANALNSKGEVISVVGRAISPNLREWRLKDPQVLQTDPQLEIELPHRILVRNQFNREEEVIVASGRRQNTRHLMVWRWDSRQGFWKRMTVVSDFHLDPYYGFHVTRLGSYDYRIKLFHDDRVELVPHWIKIEFDMKKNEVTLRI